MSDPAKKEERTLEFPSSLNDAWRQKEEVERQIRSLNKRKKALEKFIGGQLESALEPDGHGHYRARKENVVMVGYYQEYPKYVEVLAEVKEKLIPKTKLDELSEIIKRHTTMKFNTRLSWKEDEDDFGDV